MRERRRDVTALPYGINTVSLFAYLIFIMGPVYRETGSWDLAWKAGLLACLGSGIIEFSGAFVFDCPEADHAARRAPFDARRHRDHLHLDGFRVSDVREAAHRDAPARHHPHPVLLEDPLSVRAPRRARRRRRRVDPRVGARRHGRGSGENGRGRDRIQGAAVLGRRALQHVQERIHLPLPLGHHSDGALQRDRVGAEPRERRGGGRPLRNRGAARRERSREHARLLLRLMLPDDDLHRPSRLEGASARGPATRY